MRISKLNTSGVIQTLTRTTDGNGDMSESWSSPGTSVRVSMRMIDGSRMVMSDELIGKQLYELTYFDNNYGDNIRFVIDGVTYYPVTQPVTNTGRAMYKETKVTVAVKR